MFTSTLTEKGAEVLFTTNRTLLYILYNNVCVEAYCSLCS